MDWWSFSVVFATLFGPVLAVQVSKWNDERKQKFAEKLAVFKVLMSARGNDKSIQFVDAINVIDVVFCSEPDIIELKNKFVGHLHVSGTAEWSEDENRIYLKKGSQKFNDLLKAIARHLKMDASGIGGETTVYLPAWLDEVTQGQINQGKMATVWMKSVPTTTVSEA